MDMYPAWLQASYYSAIPHDEVNWAQLAQQWIAMRQKEEANSFSNAIPPPRVPSPFPRGLQPQLQPVNVAAAIPPVMPPTMQVAPVRFFDGGMPYSRPPVAVPRTGFAPTREQPVTQPQSVCGSHPTLLPTPTFGGNRQSSHAFTDTNPQLLPSVQLPPPLPPFDLDLRLEKTMNSAVLPSPGTSPFHTLAKTQLSVPSAAPMYFDQTPAEFRCQPQFPGRLQPSVQKQSLAEPPVPMAPDPAAPGVLFPSVKLGAQDVDYRQWRPPLFNRKEEMSRGNEYGVSSGDRSVGYGPDTPYIDVQQRKQLPSWIREGLEKMEKEKRKQLEKGSRSGQLQNDTTSSRGSGSIGENRSTFLSRTNAVDVSDEEGDRELIDGAPISDAEASGADADEPTAAISPEVLKEELLKKLRTCLTEILLEVTDAQILSIAQDIHRKELMKAQPKVLAQSSALASLSALGDDDDTESEAEQSGDADHTVVGGQSSTSNSDAELFKRPLDPSPSVSRKKAADTAAASEPEKVKSAVKESANAEQGGGSKKDVCDAKLMSGTVKDSRSVSHGNSSASRGRDSESKQKEAAKVSHPSRKEGSNSSSNNNRENHRTKHSSSSSSHLSSSKSSSRSHHRSSDRSSPKRRRRDSPSTHHDSRRRSKDRGKYR